MATVSGLVESKRKDGKGIKVNGVWYSAYRATDLAHVNWKDTVTFEAEAKGSFNNVKGKVTVTGSGGTAPAPSSSGSSPSWTPKSNLGVELGHASNLAMELCCKKYAPSDIGSEEFYKDWLTHTNKIYTIMAKLRKSKEEADKPVTVPTPVAVMDDPTVSDDEPF